MWSLLRDSTIRIVWVGEVVNEFGNALHYWALAWLLFRAYPERPWVAASVLSLQALGLLVGATLLGPNLDRWNRRRLLAGSNFGLAALVALIPLLIQADFGLAGLFGAALGIGFFTSLSVPSLQAILPSLVLPERLQPLQALFGLTASLSSLTAPLVAGLLIAAIGAGPVMWINAATFAFAGLWERWTEPESGEMVTTCTIITTTANELIAPLHNRM
ncbi:MAG: MFS transporter, partial [Meiothermus silvanus]|nr:MFS transporter [Allomeiothermus silvanus]